MRYTRWMLDTAKIEEAVSRAAKALAPDVVRIRYRLEVDHTGEDVIFFRIVITDDAANPKRLGDVSKRVRQCLEDEVRPWEVGLDWNYLFRSLSETMEIKDKAWD